VIKIELSECLIRDVANKLKKKHLYKKEVDRKIFIREISLVYRISKNMRKKIFNEMMDRGIIERVNQHIIKVK